MPPLMEPISAPTTTTQLSLQNVQPQPPHSSPILTTTALYRQTPYLPHPTQNYRPATYTLNSHRAITHTPSPPVVISHTSVAPIQSSDPNLRPHCPPPTMPSPTHNSTTSNTQTHSLSHHRQHHAQEQDEDHSREPAHALSITSSCLPPVPIPFYNI